MLRRECNITPNSDGFRPEADLGRTSTNNKVWILDHATGKTLLGGSVQRWEDQMRA